jgi:hypothetical protein
MYVAADAEVHLEWAYQREEAGDAPVERGLELRVAECLGGP